MKKIFTMKRVILLMSLVLIYSCAFLFVKVYAEKTIISSGKPTGAELYVPEADKREDEPAETEPTAAEEEIISESKPDAVEYIINKAYAGREIMKLAAATSVPDTIEIATAANSDATTAPTTTSAPETTTRQVETTTAPTTEPPATTTSIQTTEPGEEELLEDEYEEEDLVDGDNGEMIEVPDDLEFTELTYEELQELLERLGISDLNPSEPSPSNPADGLYSSSSYKNDIVTIYDVVQGRYRTENAFDLVCEITNYEVGDGMEPEAIKAQAVAAYTYIKYYEQKGEAAELGTKANPSDKIIQCVEAIDGLAIFYNGEYIMTPFSASQGGYSAASKNVWGGDLPYLQSVRNDYDYLDTKHFGVVTTYTVEEIRDRIESKTDIKLSNNYSEWIRILSYNDNIYAGQLSIDGHTSAYISGKERTITGHIFRTYVLNIRSTVFTVTYADGVFTFTTYGYGHGVGLSQIGANLYAKYGGYTFDQILHHYFTGVTIK